LIPSFPNFWKWASWLNSTTVPKGGESVNKVVDRTCFKEVSLSNFVENGKIDAMQQMTRSFY